MSRRAESAGSETHPAPFVSGSVCVCLIGSSRGSQQLDGQQGSPPTQSPDIKNLNLPTLGQRGSDPAAPDADVPVPKGG